MQVVRFGIVGVMNTSVDFLVLNILMGVFGGGAGLSLIACNVAAFFVASLNSYFFNKRWTFAERDGMTFRQYLLFVLFSIGGLAVNCLVLYLLTSAVSLGAGLSPLQRVNIAKVCATAASMGWNYLAYRYVVFNWTIMSARASSVKA